MASIYSLTTGQQIEVWRILSQAGFTKEDFEGIIRDPDRAVLMRSVLPKNNRGRGNANGTTRYDSGHQEKSYSRHGEYFVQEERLDIRPGHILMPEN